jgi:hypothetical protein
MIYKALHRKQNERQSNTNPTRNRGRNKETDINIYQKLLPKILKSSGFPIFRILAYMMKVIPETRRAH